MSKHTSCLFSPWLCNSSDRVLFFSSNSCSFSENCVNVRPEVLTSRVRVSSDWRSSTARTLEDAFLVPKCQYERIEIFRNTHSRRYSSKLSSVKATLCWDTFRCSSDRNMSLIIQIDKATPHLAPVPLPSPR